MERIRGKLRLRKLTARLVFGYLLSSFIPLIILTVTIYAVSSRQLQLSAMEFATATTSQIIENLDAQYDEYDRITKSLLYDRELLTALTKTEDITVSGRAERNEQLRMLLMKVKTLQPRLVNVMFLMTTGEILTYNEQGLVVRKELLTGAEWMQRILRSEETIQFSEVHDQHYLVGRIQTQVITVSRKIYDYHHHYVGILLMDLDAGDLFTLGEEFAATRSRYNMRINVSSINGLPVYDSNMAAGLISPEELAAQLSSGELAWDTGDAVVYTQQSLKTNLLVRVVIPRSQLLTRISLVRAVAAGAFLLCLLMIVLFSLFLSHSLNRPIQLIRKRMSDAEQGNYQEIALRPSTEELCDLVDSYNHMIFRIRCLIEDVYVAEIRQRDAQYLALQTQINPHMLYNTLEAIRMKAMMQGADDVADMVKILSRMFRSVLSQGSGQTHTLSDEIEYARTFLQIQNIRKPDMFFLSVEIPDSLMSIPVIPVVIQPVVENAVRHGFRGLAYPLHIRIRGKRDADGLTLSVSDDGKGMTPEAIRDRNRELMEERIAGADQDIRPDSTAPEEDHGIGLINVRDRLKLYYGEKAGIRFSRVPDSDPSAEYAYVLTVELFIPEKKGAEAP